MVRRVKQLPGETEPLLRAAAAEALGRIRSDRERVEPRLRPMLAHIEENLFDANLKACVVKRQCGVRDNNVAVRFTAAVGKAPYAYIQDRRMETAGRLLADTGLPVWQIAELVGCSSIGVFSRAFRRWSRMAPSVYRRSFNPGRVCQKAEPSEEGQVRIPGSPGTPAAHGGEIPIKRWPDVGEVRCRRLELWLPADIYAQLERTLESWNTVSGSDQQRPAERDVMITALVDCLQKAAPRWAPAEMKKKDTAGDRGEDRRFDAASRPQPTPGGSVPAEAMART